MPNLNTIPGFTALQALTLGDPRIKIAVLDGPADLDRACFKGANLSKAKTFWKADLEPIAPIYIQQELQIRKLGDKKKALKKALKEREREINKIQVDSESNKEQITSSILTLTRSHHPITAIFNAVLERTDTVSRKQYQQRKDAKEPEIVSEREETAQIDYKAEIEALEIEIKAMQDAIPKPVQERLGGIFHATGILGTMFGQPGSPVEGVAPYCTAINIPLFETATSDEALSPLNLAHAFNLALELGVNIIHCAACHPTQTGFAHEMIQKAVKKCQDNNILIVAPSGNNKGEWFCAPAILPKVLGVGMMKDNGQPANYSNWGGQYQKDGILAPGENIPAAQPGTDEPTLQEGTSLAAPLMSGLCALMMSLQLQRGELPNAEAVRLAFLKSAIPCDPKEVEEPDRCLVGKLNIPGAYQCLTGQPLVPIQASTVVLPQITEPAHSPAPSNPAPHLSESVLISASPLPPSPQVPLSPQITLTPSAVAPSAVTNDVYALGTLGYDFGSEARRDIFKQQMPTVTIDGVSIPANPYDTRQIVNYLESSSAEGKSLIWTLNQELTPIYALEPQKAFASEIYAVFQMLLAGQIQPESSDDYIERVSIPGKLTTRTVELFSGQVVPVLALPNVRGIYGWQVNSLVEAAVATVSPEASQPNTIQMRRALKSFLHRIYYDLRNLGQLDRDRALNFAATNAFQAASTFADALNSGMGLDSIEIEKSPLCRLNSNCWDVKLKFFDPENGRRAKKIYRFTIDVANLMPVTLGQVRSWSVPR